MPRTFTIIEVPYHMGLENVAHGSGPRRLLDAGAAELLASRGMPAQVDHVRMRDMRSKDLDAVVDVNRLVRSAAMSAIEQDTTPVIFAGNCVTAIPCLAALEPAETGIVWLDHHGDFNTPATSISGYLDGMALAIAVGDCHDDLRLRSGLSQPVPAANVCLPISPDLDPAERGRLEASAVTSEFPTGVEAVYLHLDVDVAGPSGEDLERAVSIIHTAMHELPVGAICVANYNPDVDSSGAGLANALRLIRALTGVA